ESESDNDGLIARVLRKDSIPAEEVNRIKDMASMILVASADTVRGYACLVNHLYNARHRLYLPSERFFWPWPNNPQCQERAWREINTVVGSDRLPTYEDRKSLPYIEAILPRSHAMASCGSFG
ncbi:hypothetical protein MPER_00623, partial [Moniliophthora perniciosa FA553]